MRSPRLFAPTVHFEDGTSPKMAEGPRSCCVPIAGVPKNGPQEVNPQARGTCARPALSTGAINLIAQIFRYINALSPVCFLCWRKGGLCVLTFLGRITRQK